MLQVSEWLWFNIYGLGWGPLIEGVPENCSFILSHFFLKKIFLDHSFNLHSSHKKNRLFVLTASHSPIMNLLMNETQWRQKKKSFHVEEMNFVADDVLQLFWAWCHRFKAFCRRQQQRSKKVATTPHPRSCLWTTNQTYYWLQFDYFDKEDKWWTDTVERKPYCHLHHSSHLWWWWWWWWPKNGLFQVLMMGIRCAHSQTGKTRKSAKGNYFEMKNFHEI